MAQRVRVTCINKINRASADERIRSIGGINFDGTRWKLPLEQAIAGIRRGEWTFYVERPGGQSVGVEIAISAAGNEYLKTTEDGEQPNNLLSLPECP
jgi:hypothetical protein